MSSNRIYKLLMRIVLPFYKKPINALYLFFSFLLWFGELNRKVRRVGAKNAKNIFYE